MISRSLFAVALFALAGGTAIADESVFETTCSKCHFEDDFSGESREDIESKITGVRAGNIEHKPSLADLSDEEIEKLAEFFASQ